MSDTIWKPTSPWPAEADDEAAYGFAVDMWAKAKDASGFIAYLWEERRLSQLQRRSLAGVIEVLRRGTVARTLGRPAGSPNKEPTAEWRVAYVIGFYRERWRRENPGRNVPKALLASWINAVSADVAQHCKRAVDLDGVREHLRKKRLHPN